MMPDVSIIIVNWNTQELLLRCLEHVYDTTRQVAFEVFVVDNASSDGSVAAVRSRFPEVQLIENNENVGFARANNQAMAVVRGRFLLLLNTDAFLHPAAVKTLVAHMDAYPDTGAAGCRLFYEDGTLQRSCSAFPTVLTELWQGLWLDRLFPRHPLFGSYMMTYWNLDDLREVDAVLGACMIIRPSALKQVGPFNEQYFMYSEEIDLCYRLKQGGWKIRFVPTATATHIWGGSARQVHPAKTFLRLYESRVQFFRSHYGRLRTWLYKLVLLLGSILRVITGPIFFLLRRDQETFHRVYNYWLLLRYVWVF